jgi:hypothetical protein
MRLGRCLGRHSCRKTVLGRQYAAFRLENCLGLSLAFLVYAAVKATTTFAVLFVILVIFLSL